MKILIASSILKIFLLSLLISSKITSIYAKKGTNKLFSCICSKAKWPKTCHILLRTDRETRGVSSLHDLGLGTLDMALFQAKLSIDAFTKILLKKKNFPQRPKYVNCCNNYLSARMKISDAQILLGKIDFVSARNILEQLCKVPNSCQKEVGSPVFAVRRENVMSEIIFDIAFVVMKELENSKNSTQAVSCMEKN